MDDIDVRAVLAAVPLFADTLDNAELDHLAAQSSVAVFPVGALLMIEGDFGTSMFAIADGSVAVLLADARGREHKVATLKPGDIVGEMSLLTGQRRSATVRAESEVVAVEITKFVLEDMFNRSPDLIDRLGGALAGRQAQLSRIASEETPGRRQDVAGQIRRFFARGRN